MGMAAGASVAGTGLSLGEARSARRKASGQRSLSKVVSFIDSYSEDVCLCGVSGAVQATGGEIQSSVNLIASVSDIDRLISTLQQEKGLPFNHVYTDGNAMSFSYSNREYVIENLDPSSYADRIAQINSQGLGTESKMAAYAHDYITYETKTRKLTDPYRAIQGKKVTLKKVIGDNTPLDFEDLIVGMIDCATLAISPSAAVAAEWASLLANPSPNDPQNIVNLLLARLYEITDVVKQDKVTELLSTPLVSASLSSIFDVKGKAIDSSFMRLKSRAPRSAKTYNLWQAAFIAACPKGSQNRTLQDCFLNKVPATGRHTAASRWKEAVSLAS